MKNPTAMVILMLLGFTMSAQKTIEKNIDYSGQEIYIKLDFATHIELKTWEKLSIYIKADLSTKDEKYLDLYALSITEGTSEIEIKSDALPVFEAFKKEYKEGQVKLKKNYTYINPKHEFNYILYVPKGSKVKVSSISGNLSSEIIESDFTADLISGNINIKSYKGNLDLTTISGEIDLKMINTSLTAETIQGNIYTDEKLEFTSENQIVGQKIAGKTGNASNNLKLSTVTGNIYLRY